MAAVLGHAGTGLLREHFSEYTPADNLYEEYGVSKLSTVNKNAHSHVNHFKRGALPPGLTPEEVKILRVVQRRANFLDKGFNVCGAEFGLSVIIASFAPGFGDVIHPVLGYTLIVRRARKAKIPWWLTQRMIINLALSGGLSLLPGLGSVLLTSFRPNVRNAALLEEFLRMRSRKRPKEATQSGAPVEKITAQEKTDPDEKKAATDDKKDTADEKKDSTDEKKAAPENEGRIELSDEGLVEGVAGAAAATALLADAGIPTLNANDNQGGNVGTTPAGGGTGTPGAGGNGQAPDASAGALAPARQDGNNDTNNQGASASVVVPGSNNNNSGGQGASGSGSGSGITPDLGEEAILELTAAKAPKILRSGEHVMEEASNVAAVANVAMGDTSERAVGSALLRVATLSAPESIQRHSRFIEDVTDAPDIQGIQDVVDMTRDMPGDWEEDEADMF